MSKKGVAATLIICVISLIFSMIAIFVSLNWFSNKEKSASEIFDEAMFYTVEVKAISNEKGDSYGTGVVISDDGKIVTNAHVVTYTELNEVFTFSEYFIRFANEEVYRAVELEKYDIDLDLAILKILDIEGAYLKSADMGDSSKIKFGQTIYAVGNASNYGIGVFQGVISVPLVNIEIEGKIRSVIQCDLTIAAGNSGGALVNEYNELIGITTFRTKDTYGNVIYGIVYCIPINIVVEFINS